MAFLNDLRGYARFSWELRDFVQHRMTLDQARQIVSERLEHRSENFLRLVERAIYGNPRSPYHTLLKYAGCELGDLRALVNERGLENALVALRDAGVYVAFEEFKGRVPIRRNGLELAVSAADFDNPFLAGQFFSETGGSTGGATRVARDLDQNRTLAPHNMLVRAAHGVLDAPFAIWRGILPDGSGMNNVLYPAYYGKFPNQWFSQLRPFGTKHPLQYTLASYSFVMLARLYGAPVPLPRYVPLDRARVVAEWAVETIQRHGRCLILSAVSRGLRVSLAAQEAGLDLSGATFMLAGEPLTLGKARGIEQSGAHYFTTYGMTEAGRVAMGCAERVDCSDVHLLKDAFALIPYAHAVEGFDVSVPAFHITTVLTSSPKLMLNVEVDDYGIVEERACGCGFGELGLTTHLRGIGSYRKLTGEGVTLLGGDMIRILEQVLPARFGGSALDYQLLEQEDARGLTRLYLLIHPRIPIEDEKAVIEVVMQSLREAGVGADAARATWQMGNSFEVKRRAPIWTARGKFYPLYVQRPAQGSSTFDN